MNSHVLSILIREKAFFIFTVVTLLVIPQIITYSDSISSVPVPASLWLFSSGLIGLTGYCHSGWFIHDPVLNHYK